MSLKKQIEEKLNEALKAKDKSKYPTLRLIVSAIKDVTGREPVINNGGGTSDGRFMTAMDAEIVELGPLNESIHKIDENVSLNDLKVLRDIYINLLRNITT